MDEDSREFLHGLRENHELEQAMKGAEAAADISAMYYLRLIDHGIDPKAATSMTRAYIASLVALGRKDDQGTNEQP